MVKKTIDVEAPLTAEQKTELEALRSRKVIADDDAPLLSEAQLEKLKKIVQDRQSVNRKETVSIRLKPETVAKAKSLGKGYTSILAEIIEEALSDIPDVAS